MTASITYRAEVICGMPGCPWLIIVKAHTAGAAEAALVAAIEAHEARHARGPESSETCAPSTPHPNCSPAPADA